MATCPECQVGFCFFVGYISRSVFAHLGRPSRAFRFSINRCAFNHARRGLCRNDLDQFESRLLKECPKLSLGALKAILLCLSGPLTRQATVARSGDLADT
jgi:hypothetical protein